MFIALSLGIALGFISAVPVAGPVSVVIFSRGIEAKYSQGRWIALGAGVVEAAYTFFAFWGLSRFLHDLSFLYLASNSVATVILIALGVYFFRSKKMRKPHAAPKPVKHSKRSILLGAAMSLVNPTLIATWSAAITTLYSMNLFHFTLSNGAFFSGGVCIGIYAWFFLLLKIMQKHRASLGEKTLDRGLKIIGLCLFALAAWMAFRVLKGLG